ncbi:MAG TPA: site-2 protease family protein [Candidatus Nanoarchaeia archaeon]|nr:site-2 protease family protein [Candidatus Nanoarchaeia archaeon]
MALAFILIALIISITLHEFAHAWMGHYLGDNTAQMQGRLTLDPRAHIDPVMTVLMPLFLIIAHSPVIFGAARPVPFNPWAVRGGKWGAAAVAAAGPFTNLLIAAFCAVWLRFVPIGGIGTEFLVTMVEINAAFCIFNLIPFPPLDGSRLLYAVAPETLRDVMDRIEKAGLVAVFLLLFVAYPFIAPVIAKLVQGLLSLLIPGVTQL